MNGSATGDSRCTASFDRALYTFPRLSFPVFFPRVVVWVRSLRGYMKPAVCGAAENGEMDKNGPEPASRVNWGPPGQSVSPLIDLDSSYHGQSDDNKLDSPRLSLPLRNRAMSTSATRLRVIGLYKELQRLGRDYPDPSLVQLPPASAFPTLSRPNRRF